jgi:hypothetical protein
MDCFVTQGVSFSEGVKTSSSEDCNSEIVDMIMDRMEKGKVAYGHGLIPDDGHNWVQEALEEALDLAIYLSTKLIQIKMFEKRNAEYSRPCVSGDCTELGAQD